MSAPLGPGSVGDAYAEFHLRTDTATNDLKKGLKKATDDADKIMQKSGKDIGKSFSESLVKEVEGNLTGGMGNKSGLVGVIEGVFTKVKQTAKEVIAGRGGGGGGSAGLIFAKEVLERDGDRAGRTFGRSFTRSFSRAVSRGAAGAGGGLLDLITNVGGGLAKGLGAIGSSIGNVGGNGPLGLIVGVGIVALILGIVGAIAALINVLGSLINVLFFLPTALVAVAAAIVPVIVGFQGFGGAVSKLLAAGNDPEKVKQALEGLSESAKKVALQFRDAVPYLKDFQQAVQESIFSNLVDIIPRLQKALGPTFMNGFMNVGDAFGRLLNNLVSIAENPKIQKFFEMLFDTVGRLINNASGPIGKFFFALADLGIATLPHFETFINKLLDLLSQFGDWIIKISENGQLEGFIQDLIKAFEFAYQLATSGWNLVKAIVTGTSEDNTAEEFVKSLITMIDKMTEFFKSDIGREGLKGMVLIAESLAAIFVGIVVTLGLISAAFSGIVSIIGRELIPALIDAVGWAARLLGLIDKANFEASFGAAAQSAKAAIANLPQKAAGDIFASGAEAVIVGEAGPEVLLPLNDPHRANELAMKSGLLGILNGAAGGVNINSGAVQINNYGSTPTAAEAYSMGQAAGQGIASVLSTRNTRLAIRTLGQGI